MYNNKRNTCRRGDHLALIRDIAIRDIENNYKNSFSDTRIRGISKSQRAFKTKLYQKYHTVLLRLLETLPGESFRDQDLQKRYQDCYFSVHGLGSEKTQWIAKYEYSIQKAILKNILNDESMSMIQNAWWKYSEISYNLVFTSHKYFGGDPRYDLIDNLLPRLRKQIMKSVNNKVELLLDTLLAMPFITSFWSDILKAYFGEEEDKNKWREIVKDYLGTAFLHKMSTYEALKTMNSIAEQFNMYFDYSVRNNKLESSESEDFCILSELERKSGELPPWITYLIDTKFEKISEIEEKRGKLSKTNLKKFAARALFLFPELRNPQLDKTCKNGKVNEVIDYKAIVMNIAPCLLQCFLEKVVKDQYKKIIMEALFTPEERAASKMFINKSGSLSNSFQLASDSGLAKQDSVSQDKRNQAAAEPFTHTLFGCAATSANKVPVNMGKEEANERALPSLESSIDVLKLG